jgi:hypothetical protein
MPPKINNSLLYIPGVHRIIIRFLFVAVNDTALTTQGLLMKNCEGVFIDVSVIFMPFSRFSNRSENKKCTKKQQKQL